MTKTNHSIALTLLILLGITWGTGYSIARFAVTNGVPPFGYSFWQSFGPALVISTLVLCRRKKKSSLTLSNLGYYLICGLTGIVIPNTAMYFAASHLPAGILALVVNIVPIVAYPMALYMQLETFHWQRMIGIGLAFSGLMLILLPKASLPSPELTPWVLYALITPLSFAFCSIYIACYRPPESDALTLSAGMLLAASLLLFPLVILTDSLYFFHYPLTAPDKIIFLEMMLSSLGYVLFFHLIKLAGPVYYSLVDTIVVSTGLFWGYLLFDEQLNKWTASAVFLILIALLLVTQQRRMEESVISQ